MPHVEFDFSKLRGRIVSMYGSCAAFCKATDKNRPWLSGRLNNKVGMAPDDIMFFCDALNIPATEIGRFFYTPKV